MKEDVLLNRALKNWARDGSVAGKREREQRWGREVGRENGARIAEALDARPGHGPQFCRLQSPGCLSTAPWCRTGILWRVRYPKASGGGSPIPHLLRDPHAREDKILPARRLYPALLSPRASSNSGQATDCLSLPWAGLSPLWQSVSLS